jgi:hypothetical protein
MCPLNGGKITVPWPQVTLPGTILQTDALTAATLPVKKSVAANFFTFIFMINSFLLKLID